MPKKFIFFFLLTVLSAHNLFSQQYWLPQSSPTTKPLTKIIFTDSLYGWVIGDSGTIVHTTNSGDNWTLQTSGVNTFELTDIFMLDRNIGWIVYVNTLNLRTFILSSTNGGLNWVSTSFQDTSSILEHIYFINPSTGFLTGYSAKIFKTTNGGLNWGETRFDTSGCFYLLPKRDIYFINAQTGYSCGGVLDFQGVILKTTDGGSNWSSLCVSPEPLNEIKYYGGNNVYVIGGDYDLGSMFIRSTNMGTSWQYDTTGCFGNATGFSFRTPKEVWSALSFNNKFAVNLDSMKPGSNWQCINTPSNAGIYDVEFMTPTKGWAVGNNGVIFKYNVSVIGINPISNFPKEFSLEQNYPNPFNPKTHIRFVLTSPRPSNDGHPSPERRGGEVKLIVFDVLGREVEILLNEKLKPGTYEIDWDGTNYPSGIYFYTIQIITDDLVQKTQTKKMVLMK